MARGEQKRQRRALARQESLARSTTALQPRPVDEHLLGELRRARHEIETCPDEDPTGDELELDPRLHEAMDESLSWAATKSRGYVFLYLALDGEFWRFHLSSSALQAACAGELATVDMVRQERGRCPP